jgi:hypothetical protein
VFANGRRRCCHDGAVLSRITRPHTRLGAAGAAAAAVGLATVAAGTFLPWVRSGDVLRDSYQAIAVVRAVRVLDGSPLALLLGAWTLLIPAMTLCFVAYALGFRRSAATISAALAIISGTVAGAANVVSGGEEIRLGVSGSGPVATVAGAALTLVGVVGIFAGRRRIATDSGGEP